MLRTNENHGSFVLVGDARRTITDIDIAFQNKLNCFMNQELEGTSMNRRERNASILSSWARPTTSGFCLVCVVLLLGTTAAGQSTTATSGPEAVIDSLTDAGSGTLRVSWSIEPLKEEEKYTYEVPHKVCVMYEIDRVTHGEGEGEECFTENLSSEPDLDVDTGLEDDAPPTEYKVTIRTFYDDIEQGPAGARNWERITMNAAE